MRTRVGYAGGTTRDPTYHSIGDHVETLQVDFDPRQVAYEDLLELFWTSHDPTRRPYSRQYASIVLFADAEQERQARESMARLEQVARRAVHTEIAPLKEFTRAEDYHQKYRLRAHKSIAGEYQAVYPRPNDFVDSIAVTRANGYLGGCGSCIQLERELPGLGLSPSAADDLHRAVCRRRR